MRIAILGAGGVGGFFGGRLASTGTDVVFVARGSHLAAIQQNGLQVLSPLGDVTVKDARAVASISEAGDVDLVMVAVKLWDTEEVARELAPIAAAGAAVVSFQNGVGKDDVLRQHLTADRVLGGVAYVSATIVEPGVVRATGPMQALTFGEYDGRRSSRVEDLHAACVRAGIVARISDNIEREIWEKFVFLVGISAITASMRHSIGSIRTDRQSRSFLLDIMREVVTVGRSRGVSLADDYAENRLTFCDTLPEDFVASMYVDLQHGNRLELPWLSGCVVDYGKHAGVPTPCNRAVSDILSLCAQGSERH